MTRRSLGAHLTALALAACSTGEAPRVVFSESSLLIDRMGIAFKLPVTVGSMASPGVLRVDRPDIATVRFDGSVVGTRNGIATIVALGTNSRLTVYVADHAHLDIVPSSVVTAPGASAMRI